jgi:hypothetical protein
MFIGTASAEAVRAGEAAIAGGEEIYGTATTALPMGGLWVWREAGKYQRSHKVERRTMPRRWHNAVQVYI